jgi:hypothetical protein
MVPLYHPSLSSSPQFIKDCAHLQELKPGSKKYNALLESLTETGWRIQDHLVRSVRHAPPPLSCPHNLVSLTVVTL